MEYYNELEVALENTINALKKYETVCTNIEFNRQANPLIGKLGFSSDEYLNVSSELSQNVNRFGSMAQSTTLSDKFISWFGLFDKEVAALKAKRSELLAKKDVQNYKYKRHYWRYRYTGVIRENIFVFINQNLNAAQFAIYHLSKSEKEYTPDEIKKIVDDYYKRTLDPNIETYLFGKKKGALYNQIVADLLGDGINEKVVEMNFKDDVSISAMLDLCEDLGTADWKGFKEADNAGVKDIQNQLNRICNELKNRVKTQGGSKLVSQCAPYMKRMLVYNALLMVKLKEWVDANWYCLKTECEEVTKVLKGLLEYKGD